MTDLPVLLALLATLIPPDCLQPCPAWRNIPSPSARFYTLDPA